MFNLEQAISEWRRQMLAAGIKAPVPLEELEGHLREEFEWQVKAGKDPKLAFKMAAQEMGEASVLKPEFKRSGQTIPKEEHMALTVFAIAVCFLSIYGGFFVIYWSVKDLQMPLDRDYLAGAGAALLLGLLMLIGASRAASICISKMKKTNHNL